MTAEALNLMRAWPLSDDLRGRAVRTVFDPLIEALQYVLAEAPWLAVVIALLVVLGLVRAVRAVIHGRHRRDAQRRFSSSQRALILSRAGHRCERRSWLYGRCTETDALQADHVHPHSRGGATTVENGQALCRRHNKQKAARVPWNWELARLARQRQAYFPTGMETVVVRRPKTATR